MKIQIIYQPAGIQMLPLVTEFNKKRNKIYFFIF